jgi:hypothetical protein
MFLDAPGTSDTINLDSLARDPFHIQAANSKLFVIFAAHAFS